MYVCMYMYVFVAMRILQIGSALTTSKFTYSHILFYVVSCFVAICLRACVYEYTSCTCAY